MQVKSSSRPSELSIHPVSLAAATWTFKLRLARESAASPLHDGRPKSRSRLEVPSPDRHHFGILGWRSQADTQSPLSVAAKPRLLGFQLLASACRPCLASRSASQRKGGQLQPGSLHWRYHNSHANRAQLFTGRRPCEAGHKASQSSALQLRIAGT
jgi:hypothetical protein